MKMLITGHRGFIGSNFEESAWRYDKTLYDSAVNSKISLYQIQNERYDVGVLLGASKSVPLSMAQPNLYLNNNLSSVTNFASLCDKIVFASSSSIYGDSKNPIKHEGDEFGAKALSPYALSKRHGEEVLELYGRVFGKKYAALRFFNVYGPKQTSGVINDWIELAIKGKPVEIFGDGSTTRDYTFVDDVCDAIMAFSEKDTSNGAYNIGAGKATSLLELSQIIKKFIPSLVVKFKGKRIGDVPHSSASSWKAFEEVGWKARYSLIEGIEESIKWKIKELG